MRLKVGRAYVQCAGDVYSHPWQEVRKVVITDKRWRKDYVMGAAYRQGQSGEWDDLIGEHRVPKSTLRDTWDDYREAVE